MTSAPSDPLVGRTLDERYVIRSRIARGGMAMVYVANDLRLERRVAVKVMHAHLADDENFTRRFEQEARSAARLAHPNVVNVFDQGNDAGHPYLVMEYLPGITLRELLKQQQRLTSEQTLEIGEAVLAGLAAAHRAGIVHRDLKPENVLLADDGRIKIGDFGLARAVSANTTTGQALLGTIAYLSPELVTRGVADARSDLYAFGIMLFEMLTGTQPFTGEQPVQIAYQHAHGEVPVPSTISSESTPEFDALVRWLTQRDPANRPADASEALAELQRIRSGSPLHATRVLPSDLGLDATSVLPSTTVLDPVADAPTDGAPEPAAESPEPADAGAVGLAAATARRRKRRGGIIALLVILAVAASAGAGWWFGQGPGSQVTVPDVAGLPFAEAKAELTGLTLTATRTECSSVEIPKGKAVSTKPGAGSRVDRKTAVELCESTGPRILPVPTLVGLPQDQAEAAIAKAGFTFGKVTGRQFSSDAKSGTVIAALGSDGKGLGEQYPEQAKVDLVVSVGTVPDVTGSTVDAATSALADKELTVDSGKNVEEFSDDIAKGKVIGVIYSTDPVRPGDSVGLTISKGPELFEVPDVSGQKMRKGVQTLKDAGFDPQTAVPELLWNAVKVEGTEPAAGEMVPKGTKITLNFEL